MEAVNLNEARAHFEGMIELFEAERALLYKVTAEGATWADPRGTGVADDFLADLIVAYNRVLKVIASEERNRQ